MEYIKFDNERLYQKFLQWCLRNPFPSFGHCSQVASSSPTPLELFNPDLRIFVDHPSLLNTILNCSMLVKKMIYFMNLFINNLLRFLVCYHKFSLYRSLNMLKCESKNRVTKAVKVLTSFDHKVSSKMLALCFPTEAKIQKLKQPKYDIFRSY